MSSGDDHAIEAKCGDTETAPTSGVVEGTAPMSSGGAGTAPTSPAAPTSGSGGVQTTVGGTATSPPHPALVTVDDDDLVDVDESDAEDLPPPTPLDALRPLALGPPAPRVIAWLQFKGHPVPTAASPRVSASVRLYRGDITRLAVSAIVNAANKMCLGGGGVDGAIHRAAGPQLRTACRKLPFMSHLSRCDTGMAVVTPAFKLPCDMVIHTVGPMGEYPDELASAYRNSLRAGVSNGATSIAFCCISTGIYGYPNIGAARVALHTLRAELDLLDSAVPPSEPLPVVVFCLFLDQDVEIYNALLPTFFGQADAAAAEGAAGAAEGAAGAAE